MYKKSVLSNGVRIITETLPHVYSASLGIWVESGSRDENSSNNGITHFIEHMLFKGTKERNAFDISRSIESVGGVINAFTTREYTFFYSKVLKDKVGLASDILSDIFLNSLFNDKELVKEKDVVGQEILMLEDNPEDHIHDFSFTSVWPSDPLGYPVQGTHKTIDNLTRNDVVEYFEKEFKRQGIIIIAVGNVSHEEIVEAFLNNFEALPMDSSIKRYDIPQSTKGVFVQKRDIEQAHICITMPGPSKVDAARYSAYVLNSILGGGMSSRLFQEIREKRGLVYSIYSSISSFRDTGLMKIHAGTTPEKVNDLISIVNDIFSQMNELGVTEEELENGKEQLKGNLLMNFESTDYRLTRLASNEMYFGEYVTPEDVAQWIEGVSLDDVASFAKGSMEHDSKVLAVIGKVDEETMPAEGLP